ncbi:MAG: S41 family peptidase [Ardenticatenaceae bacterium]|nr:S41 family peptidase [Ardenticatenaceae bacterium]HBY92401.1 peptidase S41 [Chloroflexota bacterium]
MSGFLKRLGSFLLILTLGVTLFGAGVIVGGGGRPALAAQSGSASPLRPLLEVWDLLHREYYQRPLDDVALVRGAMDGMLAVPGDPHTRYMPPDEFEAFNQTLEGELEGIGVEVDVQGGRLVVVSAIEGSPAAAAGLRAGDVIVAVDGQAVEAAKSPLSVISLVRGKAGISVTVTIERGRERQELTIVRARIPLQSVRGRLMESDGSAIGLVRLSSFGNKTAAELRTVLQAQLPKAEKGLILDLRGNPGGALDTAIQVVSEFIGDGTVMIEEWGPGQQQRYPARSGGLATTVPLVVLIDAGSASASEIVAGAIQDRGRGTLIGSRSFGKGTVQSWHALAGDNGGVRITSARWLTPTGRWIQAKGLKPDIEIANTAPGRDRQLEAAVGLLNGEPVVSDLPPWERYRQ